MSTPHAASRTALFPGWYVVGGAFAVIFLGFGGAYTFSAFVDALQTNFDASRGSVSLVFSLAGFLYFALGVISGPLADRWGARRLAMLGMLFTGAGLILAGLARNLMEVYLAYGLGVGLGVGFSYVPAVGAVQRWFSRRRGFASGLAVSGIGVGTLVMPLIAAVLIEQLDWRQSYLILGTAIMVLGIALSLLIEDDPRHRGLYPDGDPPPANDHDNDSAAAGIPLAEAIRTPRFRRLYLAGLVASFGLFVPFVHLVPYAQDHGMNAATAALLLGAIGVGSTAGRFLLGSLADRLGRQVTLMAMFMGMALSLVIWLLAEGFAALSVFAFVFGVFYGGFVALMPAIVMDYFGGRHISSIIGVLYTSVALGTLIGPTAAGYAFDLSQSYTVTILASIGANIIAAGIIASITRIPAGQPCSSTLLEKET